MTRMTGLAICNLINTHTEREREGDKSLLLVSGGNRVFLRTVGSTEWNLRTVLID